MIKSLLKKIFIIVINFHQQFNKIEQTRSFPSLFLSVVIISSRSIIYLFVSHLFPQIYIRLSFWIKGETIPDYYYIPNYLHFCLHVLVFDFFSWFIIGTSCFFLSCVSRGKGSYVNQMKILSLCWVPWVFCTLIESVVSILLKGGRSIVISFCPAYVKYVKFILTFWGEITPYYVIVFTIWFYVLIVCSIKVNQKFSIRKSVMISLIPLCEIIYCMSKLWPLIIPVK
jgi:hypothetical protein